MVSISTPVGSNISGYHNTPALSELHLPNHVPLRHSGLLHTYMYDAPLCDVDGRHFDPAIALQHSQHAKSLDRDTLYFGEHFTNPERSACPPCTGT